MRKRQGFTLVELMVVMAIVLIIMVILSRAFGDSLATLRKVKAIGEMNEKLRAATQILRRDMAADHFDGRKRVSDWAYDWNGAQGNWPQPPRRKVRDNDPIRQGCFYVNAEAVPPNGDPYASPGQGTTFEGTDDNNFPSYRVTQRTLRFTIKLRGNDPQQFFSARIPANSPLANPANLASFYNLPVDARFQNPTATPDQTGKVTFNSQWAEVYYSLRPAYVPGTNTQAFAGATPLWALYRGQFLLVANNTLVNNQVPVTDQSRFDYTDVSVASNQANNLYFNTPEDLANNHPSDFNDSKNKPGVMLLSDVVSFEVAVWGRESWFYLGQTSATFNGQQRSGIIPYISGNSSNPFQPGTQYNPPNSGNAQQMPNTPVDAIRITLRVWDVKTEQTRQITIWQDL